MKKIGLYITLSSLILIFSSCMKELDSWNSETFEYSGRFIYKLMSEDMQDTYAEGSEIQIYNTADNVQNVIWLDDHEDMFPLKSKFQLTGDATSFKSSSDDFATLDNNIYSTEDLPSPAPTATGQTVTEDEKWYIKATLLEGKIIPGAATSVGGNVSDSLYIKIKLYSGTATYTSYEVPEALRADPKVPEFKWKFTSATHDPDLDEIYVIGGYRYTGMPEDNF
ncbi:MAG: lipid-binding protein [Dysgonamonadaceae bacterium]|nr:lipid-binding protein [Dysgonamonadaceae bacterium]MDD4399899.1 lipid-binding protein [Dysgonamonadaceae bacterium]